MALPIPYLTNLDMNKNQILNFKIHREPVLPAAGNKGLFVVLETDDKLYYDNGATWVQVGASMSGSAIISAINAELTDKINEARLMLSYPTKTSLGLDQVTNHKQVQALGASSTVKGYVPVWNSTDGDKLGAGLQIVASLESLSEEVDQLATAQIIKGYVDALVGAVEGLVYKGVKDASGNIAYPAGTKGDVWKVSVKGKIGDDAVEVGDMLICLNTTEGGVAADWNIIQANIDGAVIGPTGATGNNFAAFDGATGKLIKDSGKAAGDFASSVHDHDGDYPKKVSFDLDALAIQTVEHNLGTEDVVVMIREKAGYKQQVFADVKIVDEDEISISMSVAPSANQYRVTIVG